MKGLEVLLDKIAENPSKKMMRIRYLALVSELSDPAEKAKWCLKLANFYGSHHPEHALQVAYMVCKYDPDNIVALNIIIDSFEALGRNFQADMMREHLSKVRKNLVDDFERETVFKEISVDGVFSNEEEEGTNPFNRSAEEILNNEANIDDVVKASQYVDKVTPELNIHTSTNSKTSGSADLIDTLVEGKDEMSADTLKQEDWNFTQDIYLENSNETVMVSVKEKLSEATLSPELSLEDRREEVSQETVMAELPDDFELKETKKISEQTINFDLSNEESEPEVGDEPKVDLKDLYSAEETEEETEEETKEETKEERELSLFSGVSHQQETNAAEKKIQDQRESKALTEFLDQRNQEFQNLKESNFKEYDSSLLSQMFNYFVEKSDYIKAREILESSAAFCSSQKWWKNAFHYLLESGASPFVLGSDFLSTQESLFEAEDIIKKYQKAGDLTPWVNLSQHLDQQKAEAYFNAFESQRSLFPKHRFFLFYLDLALYIGYARLVLKELSDTMLDISDKSFRKGIALRWVRANEALDFEVKIDGKHLKSESELLGSVDSLTESKFRELISARMSPNLKNMKI